MAYSDGQEKVENRYMRRDKREKLFVGKKWVQVKFVLNISSVLNISPL